MNGETWRDRLGMAGQIVGLAALFTAIAILIIAKLKNGDGPDTLAISECRSFYARAHTSGESTVVAAQVPISSRGQASVAVSCGTLKAAGKLQ